MDNVEYYLRNIEWKFTIIEECEKTMNHLLNECYDFLKDGGFSFAFCGGYAIELFLNKRVRPHGDIDISAFWEDRNTIIKYMQSKVWTVYEACGGGVVHLIDNIDKQKYIKRNIFVSKPVASFSILSLAAKVCLNAKLTI